MESKICMVTGATAGIGLATAEALVRRGAEVIVVGRDPVKGAEVTDRLRRETGNGKVVSMTADLSAMSRVRKLAGEFKDRYPRLDVLFNNVGGFYMKRRETEEGVEMTLALNLLSPFLLTNLLLPRLEASGGGRVVNVSSDAHRGGRLDFDDLEGSRRYGGFRAYARSKLGLVLFSYELARRIGDSPVSVNVVHPGFAATNLGMTDSWIMKAFSPIIRLMATRPDEAADTGVYLATSEDVAGVSGRYFIGRKAVPSSPATYDEAAARRLWYVCAEMTGL